MRNALLRLLVLALAALLPGAVRDARAAFEDIEVSPRVRAMAGAGAALDDDTYAVFHNPASLAWAGGISVAGSTVQPLGYGFSRQTTVAARCALPHGLGGVGAGFRSFGVDYGGVRLTAENTFALAHGYRLLADRQSELAIGVGVRVYALEYGLSVTGMDPGSATTAALDFGAIAVLRERTRIGFAVENLSNAGIGDRDHEQLRRRVRGGFSYAPYAGVRTAFDLDTELGEAVQYRGGVEFEASELVVLRTGVRTEPNTYTAGFGLKWRGFGIDYGFSTGGGVLGESHHVGISLRAAGGHGARP